MSHSVKVAVDQGRPFPRDEDIPSHSAMARTTRSRSPQFSASLITKGIKKNFNAQKSFQARPAAVTYRSLRSGVMRTSPPLLLDVGNPPFAILEYIEEDGMAAKNKVASSEILQTKKR